MLRLTIGEEEEDFSIHADLLCLNSPFFRRKIQLKRKLLSDEDCPNCQEELGPLGSYHLSFCRAQCGTSSHLKCIEAWAIQLQPKDYTCPFCRTKWEITPRRSDYTFGSLQASGFSIYREWLYRGDVCIEDDANGVPCVDHLVHAYILGAEVQDNEFCSVVFETGLVVIVDVGMWPEVGAVNYAYDNTTANSPLRRYLATIYVVMNDDLEDGTEEIGYVKFSREILKEKMSWASWQMTN
jgi:hypothetical protein